MSGRKYSKVWRVVAFLLLANVLVWTLNFQIGQRAYGQLHFFDVGQGDAVYYRTARGNDVLIDGGPGDAVLSKLGSAMPFTDRTLELVILTHPHADHVAGLVEVLKRFSVKKVMLPDVPYETATYQVFLDLLASKHIEVVRPAAGSRVYLDDETTLDIFYPVVAQFPSIPGDINDVSIVGRLSFGKMNALLTGDAGKDIENLFIALGFPLESEILKIGHHGSRHSTLEAFVKAVRPDYSVISVGKNSYGHPHEEVLGTLKKFDTEVLRTDEREDVVFRLYPDRVVLSP